MNRAAFFDLDGTLTTRNVWLGIFSYFTQKRLRRGTHLLFRAVHYPLYGLRKLGLVTENTFRTAWAANLAWYVRGWSVAQAREVWDWVAECYLPDCWRADTLELLRAHQAAGDLVVLVSAGPQPLLERVAASLGVTLAVGTRFAVENGRYTGRTRGPVCIDQQKPVQARAYLRKRGWQIDYKASTAYADSFTDAPLLEMTGQPAAVYPDPDLRRLALERGWRIFPE